MADDLPKQESAAAPPREPSRRRALTPEQRRLLGTPRALPHREREETAEDQLHRSTVAPPIESFSAPASDFAVDEAPALTAATPREDRRVKAQLGGQVKASRKIEMQHAIIIIGGLIFIFAIFWAGRKFDHVKGFIMSRVNAPDLKGGTAKFPDRTSDELVEDALAAERQGDWDGATERFLEAKRKDLRYQGILFHLGKGCYDRRDWDGADRMLEQALKFGENIAVANQLRGLIAVRRRDLAAAERFFEAASKAEPFMADFFYLWGDALRLNEHPREAIRRYQQGMRRSRTPQDALLFQYKIRLARIEAAEAAAVRADVEETRKAGPLPVEWLMTDAALQLHAGKIKEAAQLISEARAAGVTGLFVACAGDSVFMKAGEVHPEIASVAIAAPPAK